MKQKDSEHFISVTDTHQKSLLALARSVIDVRSVSEGVSKWKANYDASDSVYNRKAATFVTLQKHGSLRGCIGNLEPVKTIFSGIKDNAYSAVFEDPRFSPVSREEVSEITIEISILTEPSFVEYTDRDDLFRRITPQVDGVVLKEGYRKATFLPQVWESLPDHDSFFSHLFQKAGIHGGFKQHHPEIFIYKVIKFQE